MKINRLLTMRYSPTKSRPALMMLVGLCVLGGSLIASHASATETAAWVNSHVEWASPGAGSAQSTVVGWENDCTTAFNDNNASMPHSTETEQRNVVNASAYNQNVWLSRSGDAPNKITTPIMAGTSVAMQINEMQFLCAIITMNASGYGIAGDHKVTNSQYVNDRAPVPDDGAAQYKVNQASRYESNSKIYGLSISSGPGGSISNSPVNKILGYKRDNGSRYWLAPTVPFTYNVPAGLAPGNYSVIIQLKYSTIQTYHAYGASGTSRCTLKNGSGATIAYGNYDICIQYTEPYIFRFTVAAPPVPYNLTPSVGASITQAGNPVAGNVAQAGDVVSYTYQVSNAGDPSPNNIACGIYATSHVGNFSPPSNTYESPSNVSPYTPPATGCPRSFANGVTKFTTETYTVTNADVGHTICRSLMVNPSKAGGGAVGRETCVVVAAEPYVAVAGGDVSVGGGISSGATSTTCTPQSNASISSWNQGAAGFNGAGSQFAAMALGVINGFATAKSVNNATMPSGLAFSNTVLSGTYGGSFGQLPCIPDYFAQMPPATTISSPVNIGTLATGTYLVTGNATISGSVAAGHQVAIYVDGDTYIPPASITYSGSWTYDQAPLAEIISRGNLYVDQNVGQMDGAYIAQPTTTGTKGAIYTCATATGPYALDGTLYGNCNKKQLVVNGLFSAYQIYLMRTAGTVSAATNYATGLSNAGELFNYNPAMWIAQPPTNGTGKYDAITSLPPIL
ncbi:MAG: hypothetical protein ACQR33_04400 [Candidatus Saccharibacteria bacterium]